MSLLDDHLASFPESDQAMIRQVYDLAKAAAPDVEEGVSYGVPAWRLDGKALIAVSQASKYYTLMPFSADVVAEVVARHPGLNASKGTIRFTAVQPVADAVVNALIAGRIAEIRA